MEEKHNGSRINTPIYGSKSQKVALAVMVIQSQSQYYHSTSNEKYKIMMGFFPLLSFTNFEWHRTNVVLWMSKRRIYGYSFLSLYNLSMERKDVSKSFKHIQSDWIERIKSIIQRSSLFYSIFRVMSHEQSVVYNTTTIKIICPVSSVVMHYTTICLDVYA